MESKFVSRAKSLVNAKVRPIILSHCPHHLLAGHNKSELSEKEVITEGISKKYTSEMFQEYPYKSDLPKPLLPPSKVRRDRGIREDSSLELIHTKMKIQEDKDRYVDWFKKHPNFVNQEQREDVEWTKEDGVRHTTLPKYLAATADILECDPDPYFSGTYNWYYSGGTLSSITHNSKNVLIFPYSGELIALPVTLKDDSQLMPDFGSATKVALKDDVYQVVCSVSNNSGRVLTRHRSRCCVYDLFNLNKSKLKFLEVWRSRPSEIPYISADLDPININLFCTLNVERTVVIRDVNKSQRLLTVNLHSNKSIVNNWAFIKFDACNSHILKFVDTNCVQHYDIRSSMKQPALTICPGTNLEDCEHLSAFIPSCRSEHYSYVGSNHSLCLLDVRYPNSKVVRKWSHQFKSTPLFAEVCLRDNDEFVVIASQLAGETAVILNTWSSNYDKPESCCTPYTPSSNIETLAALQFQGKGLDPLTQNRLLLCNTGCNTMMDEPSGEIFLSTQNSLDDIFYQGIGHHEPLSTYSMENCKALYKLTKWEQEAAKHHSHRVTSPLVVTKRTSARNFFRTFSNQTLDCNDADNQNNLYDYIPSWKRNVSELESFVDIFAPELLAPWEVVEETPAVPVTPTSHLKVLSWLGMSEEAEPKLSQTEPCIPPKSVFEESRDPPVVQDLSIPPKEEDGESIQQLLLPKVSSQNKNKNKNNTKKANYVPGF